MKRQFSLTSFITRLIALACLGLCCQFAVALEQDTENRAEAKQNAPAENDTTPTDSNQSTVGFPKLIFQHVIEGSKVVAKPISDKTQPMIVRIVDTYPHGSNFRYDIEYKSLEPGKFNVAEYLTREDGSELPIPPIEVEVSSLLGPGQVEPYLLPPKPSGYRSFYLPAMLIGGVIWLGGLLMILFYGRGKKKRPIGEQKNVTVADRLRPLIDSAIAGKLEAREQAELERVLSSFWSKKLRLTHLPADKLREHLRGHPEASVLLNQIDYWLHRPQTDPSNQIIVNEILKPYQTMNYDDVN